MSAETFLAGVQTIGAVDICPRDVGDYVASHFCFACVSRFWFEVGPVGRLPLHADCTVSGLCWLIHWTDRYRFTWNGGTLEWADIACRSSGHPALSKVCQTEEGERGKVPTRTLALFLTKFCAI
ncbi:hypothetical protein GCM10009813_20180 [Brevibacterium marinum]